MPEPLAHQRAGMLVGMLILAGCDASAGPSDHTTPGGTATTYESSQEFQAAALEHTHRMIGCLADLGWSARVDHLGRGYEVMSVTAQNRESFIAAQKECEDRFGPGPAQAPLDSEQLELHYADAIAVKHCLEQQGFSISEPPSLELFIADYESAMSGGERWPWNPWSDIDAVALGRSAFEELERQCVQPGW